MSKKRFIDSHFWSDTWVDGLTRDERFFFMYLLTNDKTSIAGVYEIPLKMIAFESGFTQAEVLELFRKLRAKVHYVNGWVVMKNAIKNQNYKNTKIERGIEIILQNCPPELIEFVNIPDDFKKITLPHVEKSQQQGLFHESSMSHHVLSHSDTDSDTEFDSNSDAAAKDSNKFDPKSQTPKQKRQYAIAMNVERGQQKRVVESRTRSRSKVSPIMTPEEIEAIYEKRTIRT
jgi:hypothetical protein